VLNQGLLIDDHLSKVKKRVNPPQLTFGRMSGTCPQIVDCRTYCERELGRQAVEPPGSCTRLMDALPFDPSLTALGKE